MKFEFDAAKSAANKAKHKIDFIEAQKLWLDVDALGGPARSDQEPRKMLIGKIGNKLWTAIFTERSDRIRLISVRAARIREEMLYEQTENDCRES